METLVLILTPPRLREALELLAERLDAGLDAVDLLLVGGAAGLLTGELPRGRTTEDCDVVAWTPPAAWDRVLQAAAAVALELGLSDRWLNNGAHVFVHRLLPGWEERCRVVLQHGLLTVSVPGRIDFLSSKLLAGRDVDLDDVIEMGMTDDEFRTLRDALTNWPESHFASGTIPRALERLEAIHLQEDFE